MTKFKIEILSPERTFFAGEAESLIVETEEGQLGILAHHKPIAIGLVAGVIKLKTGEREIIAANGEGFVEVRPDKTIILCQSIDSPEEIELAKLQKIIETEEKKLREAKSKLEYNLSKASLARAFAKLRVKT